MALNFYNQFMIIIIAGPAAKFKFQPVFMISNDIFG